MTALRLFTAIKINHTSIIEECQQDLKRLLPKSRINWSSPGNFHITLQFLGDVEPYFINSINIILKHIAEKNSAFSLQSGHLNFFGKISSPRVIYYGFEDNPLITRLQNHLMTALQELGFGMDDKKIFPHVTLGRVKYLNEQDAFRDYITEFKGKHWQFPVEQINLYQSILKPEGPEYKILETFNLEK